MAKMVIESGEKTSPLHDKRVISIVDFAADQGWDVVEYDNAGQSKFKLAEIPPQIPLDRMTEADQQKFILTILEVYDERLIPNVRAKPLSRTDVLKIYNRIAVPVSRNPS